LTIFFFLGCCGLECVYCIARNLCDSHFQHSVL
jgi:hypothetical protein